MNLFTDHPSKHGLSYIAHMKLALWGGAKMILAGFACLIHAFLPFLFKWVGVNTSYEIFTAVESRKTARKRKRFFK